MNRAIGDLILLRYKTKIGTNKQCGTVVYVSDHKTEDLEGEYVMFRPSGMNNDIKIKTNQIESWEQLKNCAPKSSKTRKVLTRILPMTTRKVKALRL